MGSIPPLLNDLDPYFNDFLVAEMATRQTLSIALPMRDQRFRQVG